MRFVLQMFLATVHYCQAQPQLNSIQTKAEVSLIPSYPSHPGNQDSFKEARLKTKNKIKFYCVKTHKIDVVLSCNYFRIKRVSKIIGVIILNSFHRGLC